MPFPPLSAIASAFLLAASSALASEPIFLGLTNKVAENRGIIAVNDPSTGKGYIASFMMDSYGGMGRRCSLLLTDVQTGRSEQFWFPKKEVNNGELFHLLRSAQGKLYTTFGTARQSDFVEFDLAKRQWSYSSKVKGMAMSFTEADDGTIYFATYPESRLYAYDPAKQTTKEIARLDPQEQYPFSLAAGQDGWLYAGIGTARSNIVAIHRKSGKVHSLLKEEERLLDSAEVTLGSDGIVYGRAARQLKDATRNPWLKLVDGKATPLPEGTTPSFAPKANLHFYNILNEFPRGGRIVSCSIPEQEALIEEPDGKRKTLALDYESDGAINTALALGDDGKIYGDTNHPVWFFKYDPVWEKFTDLGTLRGGQPTNLAPWQGKLVGAAYPNGGIYLYDPEKPWTPAEAGRKPAEPNPRLLKILDQIKRPRVSRLLKDGKTLVVGGFPGYGHITGGIALYNLETGELRPWSLEHDFPGQSAFVIRELPNGLLAVGTSTETPGGGQRISENATFFVFDPVALKVVRQTSIKEHEIRALDILPDGTVFLLANDNPKTTGYRLDAETGEILAQRDLSEHGTPLSGGHSLVRNAETGTLYAILSRSIARIDENGNWTLLHKSADEITAGSVILNHFLYYTTGSRLMKFDLPAEPVKSWPRPYALSRLNRQLPPLLAEINKPEEWAKRRNEIKKVWDETLGDPGASAPRPAPDLQILESKERDGYTEQRVLYKTAYNDTIPALLLLPNGASAESRRPGILALHPTNAIGKTSVATPEGRANRMYGLELVRRGYIVLAPDALTSGERIAEGRSMFDSTLFYEQHPTWSTVGKNLADHQQALDVLSRHPFVDANRLAAIGHSFGAYNAYFLSAQDERVKAVVASCGVAPFANSNDIRHWGHRPMPYTHLPLLTPQLEKGVVPFEFNEIIALTAPRPQFYYSGQADTIFRNWKEAGDCYQSVGELYQLLGAPDAFRSLIGNGKHDFPPEIRQQAYEFLDHALQFTPSPSQ